MSQPPPATDRPDAGAAPDARQRNRQLQFLAESFPEGVVYQYSVMADGRRMLTYLGRGAERILGDRPPSIPIGIEWLTARILPGDEPGIAEAGEKSRRFLTRFDHDVRVRTTDGSERWVSFRTQPREMADGSVVWDGVILDVTGRHSTEESARRQVEFLAALNEMTLELLDRREVNDLLQALAQRASVLLKSPHAEISLLEGGDLVVRAFSEGHDYLAGDRVRRDEPALSWRAVDSLRPVVTEHYPNHPDSRDVYRASGIRSAAVFPIVRGQVCVGVLGVARPAPAADFTADDIEEGRQLAQLAALVLHNAAIYEDAVRATEARTVALRESEERFRAVFAESAMPIALVSSPDGRIVEINPACALAFGFRPDEVVGRTTRELNLWADLELRDRYLEKLRTERMVTHFEAVMRRKNGEVFTVLYSGCLVTIGGRPYSINSMEDITARKQSEAALRESEERFRVLADVSPVGIFSSDPTGRCLFVNRRWCEIAGMTAQEALDDGWKRALHPDDAAGVANNWNEAVNAGESSAAEFRFVRPDGAVTWLVGQSRAQHKPDGSVAGYVGTITDVTTLKRAEDERKQIEAQLRQSRKMESLGTLAGGIAHDFNNILNGTFGFVDLARLEISADHPVQALLDQIASSSQRARELVRQILTFSRKNEGERLPQRLHRVVAEALRLLRSSLPPNVTIEEHLAENAPPALVDASQIHQVVLNLCTNAAQAMPERGGRMIVTLEEWTVTEEQAASHADLRAGLAVRLKIADDGCGMDAATLDHIFEPFFTTKETGAGTGLGLAVVHGIVKSHEGAILVHSSVGNGSVFEVYFPAVEIETLPPAAAALDVPHGHGERVLVVDDDKVSGYVIERVLQSLGYQPSRCTRPEEALARFGATPAAFDLVVSDLAMPGMNGEELIERLRQIRADIPIIVVSGFVETARQRILAKGLARAVLRKPVTREELGRAVAEQFA